MLTGTSYSEFHSKYQNALEEKLREEKIDESLIHDILESGFYLWGDSVQDGYYAHRGSIHFSYFVNILKGTANLDYHKNIPTYTINSIKDAEKVLEQPFYKRNIDDICFRGQTTHFTSKRPFPHPSFANNEGSETLILPGFWRPYLDDNNHISNNRPMEAPTSFLRIIGDRLQYYGIDVQKLWKRNMERYGIHSADHLEDFPDQESQEYYRRHRLNFTFKKDLDQSLIEQHYGLPTVGLDVTFDLKTALFFATNKFIWKNKDKGSFIPVSNNHEGVIYLLRFTSPKLMKSRDQVVDTPIFEHIPPIRPIKQSCGLPFFHSNMVNEAAANIIGILKIGKNFDYSDVYSPAELFPDRNNDPFYNVLLELKEEFPEYLKDIIDYDFTS